MNFAIWRGLYLTLRSTRFLDAFRSGDAGHAFDLADFKRDFLRERVVAGIANARANGKPHGRPRTASLKRDKIHMLKKSGLNHSQISKKLKISRLSVINQLRQ